MKHFQTLFGCKLSMKTIVLSLRVLERWILNDSIKQKVTFLKVPNHHSFHLLKKKNKKTHNGIIWEQHYFPQSQAGCAWKREKLFQPRKGFHSQSSLGSIIRLGVTESLSMLQRQNIRHVYELQARISILSSRREIRGSVPSNNLSLRFLFHFFL